MNIFNNYINKIENSKILLDNLANNTKQSIIENYQEQDINILSGNLDYAVNNPKIEINKDSYTLSINLDYAKYVNEKYPFFYLTEEQINQQKEIIKNFIL